MAKKPPKTGLDPLKIFQHATRFHESDHRLRNTVPPNKPEQIPLVVHPAMVLSAFASELYLKCLLCAEKNAVPDGHNLKLLFEELEPTTQKALEELWNADAQQPHRQLTFNAIRSRPDGKNFREDLQYALDVGADSFIELRYFYEKGVAYFVLGEFPNMLRKVILDRFPAWR
jgi:hypothetical protein